MPDIDSLLADLRRLELIHYSAKPMIEPLQKHHPLPRRDEYFKPIGLWVSVRGDYDWKWWCEAESFALENLTHATRVILGDEANILLLSDAKMIDDFTEEFRLRIPQYRGDRSIDWPLIRERFDGIVIAPYCWERRLSEHTFWYYGWDCASGCIWNPAAIAALVPEDSTPILTGVAEITNA